MTEREFWIAVRAALLAVCSAIERRYNIGKHSPAAPVHYGETDTVAVAE